MGKENGTVGGDVIKSEDPGETLEEAGLSDGGEDGAEDKADEKVDDVESDEAGDEDSDAGGEGEEADGDGKTDGGEGGEKAGREPSEVDVWKTLAEKREAEVRALKEAQEKKSDNPPPPQEMSEEQWAKLEERFGGMSRSQITPIAEMVDKAVSAVRDQYETRLAGIEKELRISQLSEQDGYRDIRSHRAEVEQFLGNFDKKMHSDEKLLKMALIYARGLKTKDAVKKASEARERNVRIAGASRPSTSGASAAGSEKSVKLTAQERQAAKLGGMTEKEYIDIKYGGSKRK